MTQKIKINKIIDAENNPFDRQERISWWSQEKLKDAKVMVVGAGAIGNETLKNLALMGIGNIFIVDFDTISTSNLSRTVLFRQTDKGKKKAKIAAERTKELSLLKDVNIDWFHGDIVWDLGTGVYNEMDIVLGCLDNIETRFHVNRQCWLTNTPWIDAGIYELGLRVNFYQAPHVPCYQCSKSPDELMAIRKRYSCDEFKRKVVNEGKMPTTQIASAMVSALQVQETIKFLCNQSVSVGKQIYFQGKINDFEVMQTYTKPECLENECCMHIGTYSNTTSLSLSNEITLKEFLEYISQTQYSGVGASLDFRGDNRSFIESVSCRTCQEPITMLRPSFRIFDEETICKDINTCIDYKQKESKKEGINMEVETSKIIHEDFNLKKTNNEILGLTLSEIGIPRFHILSVKDKNGNYKYYELKGDQETVLPNITTNME